jgi:hypothetical protein
VKNARNIAIVLVLALLLTVLPAGGNVASGILAALGLIFLGSVCLLIVRFWRENALTRDVLTERQRGLIYGSAGAIALAVAATDELFDTGLGTVVWVLVLAAGGWLIFNTWREANSY